MVVARKRFLVLSIITKHCNAVKSFYMNNVGQHLVQRMSSEKIILKKTSKSMIKKMIIK